MAQEKISERSLEKVLYSCGSCKWLNGEKTSVGIECTCPDKVWRSRVAKYHYKTTKACKMIALNVKCEILHKLPSLNEYVDVCRANPYKAAKFKKEYEDIIGDYLIKMPIQWFSKPIKIHFHWVEGNKRRDLDNVAFAKKFILDAMVKGGFLANDNRKHVTAFTDTFEYGKETKVILEIEEVNDEIE